MSTTRRTSRTAAAACTVLLPLSLATGCGGGDSTPDADRAGVDAPLQTTAPGESTEPSPSASEEEVTAFSDTFDDDANGWALPPTEDASSEVRGGDFVWEIKAPGLRPHMNAATLATAYDAGNLEMTDVRVTASVTPRSGAAAFGLYCREVPDTDSDFQWYEFVVRDGYAAIRLADMAGNLDVIAEGEADVAMGKKLGLEIDCVGDDLSLMVDGEQVLTASAPEPLGSGVPGLQAYNATADESSDPMVLAWHDFAVEPA